MEPRTQPDENITSMVAEPSTPQRPQVDEPNLSPSSNLPSLDTAPSSARSSRKRTNDEVYMSSPKQNNPSLHLSTAPDQLSPTPPKQLWDFNQVKPRKESTDNAMNATGEGGPQPGLGVDFALADDHDRSIPTFVQQIEEHKRRLEDEYAQFEHNLQTEGQGLISDMNWEDLETRYQEAISPFTKEEEELLKEFSDRFQHFLLWMQISNTREADRAIKRLRTRVAFVKNSEEKLAEKQAHHNKVLSAFQSAMALLGSV